MGKDHPALSNAGGSETSQDVVTEELTVARTDNASWR
jgi:hypothetical protein